MSFFWLESVKTGTFVEHFMYYLNRILADLEAKWILVFEQKKDFAAMLVLYTILQLPDEWVHASV